MPDPAYWIAPDELIARATARIGRSLGEDGGASNVPLVAESSIRQAHGVIVTILGNKGWTLAQLNQWDYRKDYLTRMALYWFFTDLSTDGFDQERLRPYDVRPDLSGKDFALIVNGVPLKPSQGDTGTDGLDLDNLPGGDAEVFGNASFAVGRFSQSHWPVRRNTRF